MSQLDHTYADVAYDILSNINRTLKGPFSNFWPTSHYIYDMKKSKIYRSHKIGVCGEGDKTLWMSFDHLESALKIFTIRWSDVRILISIDIGHPRSLVRAYLRERIKEARLLCANETEQL